jgi:hypothetical protein
MSMNRKLKKCLRQAFDAPPLNEKRKNEFLLSANFPKTAGVNFLLAQIRYIRKRVWITSLLAVIPVLIFLSPRITENGPRFVWMISSLLPFIALAGITEIARSVSYNMAELEMSCQYSFSAVVLARLGILGGADTILFAVMTLLLHMIGNVEILRLGVYLFVPFLLTCALSLFAFNRLRSKESVYICGCISGFVSTANALVSSQYAIFENMTFWYVSFFILLIWTAGEIIKLIKRTGENQWNLSSTA